MMIINTIGGMGNQMFQVALAYSLFKRTQQQSKLSIFQFDNYTLHHGFDLQRIFGLNLPLATANDLREVLGWRHYSPVKKFMRKFFKGRLTSPLVIEPNEYFNPQILTITHDAYLEGYWQTEKYFIEFRDDVRQLFSFKPTLNQANESLLANINSCNSVSIHIRRGDYVSNKLNQAIYSQCTPEYYHHAISTIAESHANPRFFVFSDDIAWSKELFKDWENITFVSHNQGKDSFVDMQLMSACKHNIIANSTFSWWGAWLNNNPDKMVISPREWFLNGRSSKDLIPEKWIKI